jgi:hypothetical protein
MFLQIDTFFFSSQTTQNRSIINGYLRYKKKYSLIAPYKFNQTDVTICESSYGNRHACKVLKN